ncbi:translation initiation factor eIF3 subunit 135-domain-containing protein [Gaertneriomyces semiglobifer]|nr:translation initiation factor eIF3 subunit 135-domain-containing protein [Gaertneriomyces semiglobifer]
MLAVPTSTSPIKQGWLSKKGGSKFLTHWRQKYLVLSGDDRNAPYKLSIYDQVDQSKPAKHEVLIGEARVEALSEAKVSGLKKGAAPFVVIAQQRKFYFAAQTRTDRDAWVAALCAGGSRSTPSSGHNQERRATINHTFRAPHGLDHHRPLYRSGSVKYRTPSRRLDDDAVSVYSFATSMDNDDAASVYTSMSRTSSFCQKDYGDETRSIASSRLETLSFCSEPVLTPQELTLMGNSSRTDSSCRIGVPGSFGQGLRRRRAPIPHMNSYQSETKPVTGERWNERYQALLALPVDSSEAALRQDVQIAELIGSFQETAQQTAQRLIDEFHLNVVKRTADGIKDRPFSAAIADVASSSAATLGVESVCLEDNGTMTVTTDSIVYYFACDYLEATPSEIEDAMARTSGELRAIDATTRASFSSIATHLPHLHTALMVLVDYKGFRVVAYADMSSEKKMLQVHYLAQDPPRTDEHATERLSAVGSTLNLKPHAVQIGHERRIQVHMAASVEVTIDPATKFFYASNLYDILPIDYFIPDELNVNASAKKRFTKTGLTVPVKVPGVNIHRRLRPEFVLAYRGPLTADAFREQAGATRRERESNDVEVMRASKFLHDTVIPAFVKNLDELNIRPVDSRAMTSEMHCAGVNVRYLGMIARLSTLPYVRGMAAIEMVARSCKSLFRHRLRNAILHFRSVGATLIDDEMTSYAAGMFSTVLGTGDKAHKYFEERLRAEILKKFNYDLTYEQFRSLHRPALFLSLQYHCGVKFEDSRDYDFDSTMPVARERFIQFVPRVKQLSGLPRLLDAAETGVRHPNTSFPEEERLAYLLARHFKALGPRSKLAKTDASSAALSQVSAHYSATGLYEEARLYAQAAISAANRNSCLVGLAQGQLVRALAGLQADALAEPDVSLIGLYQQAVAAVQWHWSAEHPAATALHDCMAAVYLTIKKPQQALKYYSESLQVAEKALGKSHVVTGAYLTKIGCLLQGLRRTEEAIERFTDALHVYEGLNVDDHLVAQVHYEFAEVLASRGDHDAAIEHAHKAKALFETTFGQSDGRTVESYRQVARLVLNPFKEYRGVLTPQVRAAHKEAITCLERVFRYVKKMKPTRKQDGLGKAEGWKSSVSVVSMASSVMTTRSAPAEPSTAVHETGARPTLGVASFPHPIAGPLAQECFPTRPSLAQCSTYQLTRQIVRLKIRLLESPQHHDTIRALRAHSTQLTAVDGAEARGIIHRLSIVSPSSYFDGIMSRIDERDEAAIEELGVLLYLIDNDAVAFA